MRETEWRRLELKVSGEAEKERLERLVKEKIFPDKTWQLYYLVSAFDLDSGRKILVFECKHTEAVFQYGLVFGDGIYAAEYTLIPHVNGARV